MTGFKGSYEPEPAPMDVPIEPATVILCEGWPGKPLKIEPPLEIPASDLLTVAMRRLVERLPSWRKQMVYLDSAAATSPLRNPGALADGRNRIGRHRLLSECHEYLVDDDVARASDACQAIRELCADPDTLGARAGAVGEQIARLRRIPGFAPLMSDVPQVDESSTKAGVLTAVQELEVLADVLARLETPTTTALANISELRLEAIADEIEVLSENMKNEAAPYTVAFAALDSYIENVGTPIGKYYVISVPNLRKALQEDSEYIVKLLLELDEPYLDILLLNAVGPKDVEKLAQALDTKVQHHIWAGYADYTDRLQLQRTFPNPIGSAWAGNIHMTAGKGTWKGVEGVPLCGAVLGLRHRLDRQIAHHAGAHGVLTPLFGRKGPRDVFGFDDIDTRAWPKDFTMALSAEKGLNIVVGMKTGVDALVLDRSRSGLVNAKQATFNRAAQILVGYVREWLSINAVAEYNDPAIVRDKAREAEDIYVVPLLDTPGFSASLDAKRAAKPTEALFHMRLDGSDPIETFKIIVSTKRNQLTKKGN